MDKQMEAANVHELKTWPDEFDAILLNLKTHEFRKDDRGFKVGDTLILQEWNPETERYTGRNVRRTVTYIGKGGFGIPEGYAVLSIAGWNDRGAANEWVRIVNVNELPDEGEYWVTTKDGHVVQNEFHSAPRFARPVPLHAVRAVMPFNRPAPYQPATNGSTEGE